MLLQHQNKRFIKYVHKTLLMVLSTVWWVESIIKARFSPSREGIMASLLFIHISERHRFVIIVLDP